MIIRTYTSEDEIQVIRLWAECGLVVPHNNPLQDIERKLRVNPEWFLVGEAGNQIIATCMAGYEGHRGWINYLAIAPSQRGKKLATEMMEKAEQLLRAKGCPKINLQIRSANRRVVEFYQSLGYKIDETISMGKRLEVDGPYQAEQPMEARLSTRVEPKSSR
jgi:ribosomal protein S18 acetylase RimI-like enzyme